MEGLSERRIYICCGGSALDREYPEVLLLEEEGGGKAGGKGCRKGAGRGDGGGVVLISCPAICSSQ